MVPDQRARHLRTSVEIGVERRDSSAAICATPVLCAHNIGCCLEVLPGHAWAIGYEARFDL
jgi:hypothetical protein